MADRRGSGRGVGSRREGRRGWHAGRGGGGGVQAAGSPAAHDGARRRPRPPTLGRCNVRGAGGKAASGGVCVPAPPRMAKAGGCVIRSSMSCSRAGGDTPDARLWPPATVAATAGGGRGTAAVRAGAVGHGGVPKALGHASRHAQGPASASVRWRRRVRIVRHAAPAVSRWRPCVPPAREQGGPTAAVGSRRGVRCATKCGPRQGARRASRGPQAAAAVAAAEASAAVRCRP